MYLKFNPTTTKIVDLFQPIVVHFAQAYSIISEENLQVKSREILYSRLTLVLMTLNKQTKKIDSLTLQIRKYYKEAN